MNEYSRIFLKDPDQCTCLIFTGRLLMDLFSDAEGSRIIPCSIHSSCISLEFIAGNILLFQHLTENGISHSIVALPAAIRAMLDDARRQDSDA